MVYLKAKYILWLQLNKLKININKTKCTFFEQKINKVGDVNIKINSKKLEKIKCTSNKALTVWSYKNSKLRDLFKEKRILTIINLYIWNSIQQVCDNNSNTYYLEEALEKKFFSDIKFYYYVFVWPGCVAIKYISIYI